MEVKRRKHGTVYGNGYYINATISSFIEINIIGDYDNIKNLETMWEYIIENISWPLRYYYRLIDADNKPVTSLTEGKGIDDYCYTSSAQKYYDDDGKDGWFWQCSIPLDLYNAIGRAEGKYRATQTAMNSGSYQEGQTITPDWTDIEQGHGKDVSQNAAEGVRNILSTSYKLNTEDFTKYVPIVLNVTNHWFEDLVYDAIEGSADGQKAPCYKFDDSEEVESEYPYVAIDTDPNAVKDASEANVMYIQEKAPGKITQEHKPKSKNRGVFLEELLEQDYYIYDGYGRSKEKKKIDFKNISVDAIAMLEQIQGEDAQQIIRMFKIFMATHGVKFEATEATAYKKEICSKVLSDKDWNCADNLLVEDNSSYVLRADIPPSQYGFPISTESKMIYALAPVNGEVVYRSDDNVCIKINDTAKHKMDEAGTVVKSVKDWTLLISGIAVHDDIQEGKIVTVGQQIGHTVKRDIKMILRDENGAIVENTYKTIVNGEQINTSPVQYDEHEGNITREVNGYRTADDIDYVVKNSGVFEGAEKTRIGEANGEFIQALVKMQEEYGIDPLWALAVAHCESNCGTARDYEGQHRLFNISSGWKDKNGRSVSFEIPVSQGGGAQSGDHNFATYRTDEDAIMDFGNYASNKFDRKLITVDDFEEYSGMKLFEGAKKKDYPLYLQLKTILSGKGV